MLDHVLVVFGNLFAELDVVFGYLFLASFGCAFRPVAAFDSYLIGCRLAACVKSGDCRSHANLLALLLLSRCHRSFITGDKSG